MDEPNCVVGLSPSSSRRKESDGASSMASNDKRCSLSVGAADSGGEEGSGSVGSGGSPSGGRVPRKFIATWRHACDKTKDRTKDLFKRWRTLPETGPDGEEGSVDGDDSGRELRPAPGDSGWSVHVWATWVKRYPSDEEDNLFEAQERGDKISDGLKYLTIVQREKLEHLFSHLFDMDRDDLISIQDFESFCERLRRFADWTENSPEFVILQQIKDGFVDYFILAQEDSDKELISKKPYLQVLSLEEWLGLWGVLLNDARSWCDFPLWLQYLPRVLYQAINTTGSGVLSCDELNTFYSSMLGLSSQSLSVLRDKAYNSMTANGEHPLTYSIYRLCFANFLLGRYPNGPGHYIFGHVSKQTACFPIDYSAMNTPPDQLEQYTVDIKTNRRSVIV